MIVSTTLTGSNAEIIGDAIASVVEHVDRCLVIDTGAKDDSIEVARRVAGDKLLLREFPGRTTFPQPGISRSSRGTGGRSWAVTLDTDERMLFEPGIDLAGQLEKTACTDLHGAGRRRHVRQGAHPAPAGQASAGAGRRTSAGRAGECELARLEGVRFHELPKDPAAAHGKFERDVALLKRYTKQHAKQARWFYYLGASHQQLGEYAAAIDAFRTCANSGAGKRRAPGRARRR